MAELQERPFAFKGNDVAALVRLLNNHQCGCGGACGQQTPAYIKKAADALERLHAIAKAKRPFSDALAQSIIDGQAKTIDRLTKELQEVRGAP